MHIYLVSFSFREYCIWNKQFPYSRSHGKKIHEHLMDTLLMDDSIKLYTWNSHIIYIENNSNCFKFDCLRIYDQILQFGLFRSWLLTFH